MASDLDSCIAWLDRLDEYAGKYIRAHVDNVDSLLGWTWGHRFTRNSA